jgi:RNA polymerase sigma-70 factor (ECF subfamily)
VFRKIGEFEHRGEGAFQAYLRQAVLNRIRNELRSAASRPCRTDLDSAAPDDSASPLERAIGAEGVERYEAALQRLREEERELIIARLELGLTYSEIAAATGRPSPDAARMAIGRAIVRLTEVMKDVPGTSA